MSDEQRPPGLRLNDQAVRRIEREANEPRSQLYRAEAAEFSSTGASTRRSRAKQAVRSAPLPPSRKPNLLTRSTYTHAQRLLRNERVRG